jgi:hypothetical protein
MSARLMNEATRLRLFARLLPGAAPFVFALIGVAGAGLPAAADEPLVAPHRAVYDLELKDASERSGKASAGTASRGEPSDALDLPG